jgi:hypothetical protein
MPAESARRGVPTELHAMAAPIARGEPWRGTRGQVAPCSPAGSTTASEDARQVRSGLAAGEGQQLVLVRGVGGNGDHRAEDA